MESLGRVAVGGPAKHAGVCPVQTLPPVIGQVDVGDHLIGEHVQIRSEVDGPIVVGEQPELVQHPFGEGVQRDDRCVVDLSEGLLHTPEPGRQQLRFGGGQHPIDMVVSDRTAVDHPLQRGAAGDQPVANALTQFGGRATAEGHRQDLPQRDALADEPGDHAGDGVRLAGAGAGLEHGGGAGVG